MSFRKIKRRLRVAIVNVAVTLVLLIATELICRYIERLSVDGHPAAERRVLPPKGRSELRVFAFGGSTVYGVPAPEVGFVSQLQYWLKRLYPDRDVRLYNFGWPGLDTSVVLQEFTRRLDDHPDLSIVITGHNEFLGPRSERRLSGVREVLSHLATMRMLRRSLERITKSKEEYVMPCQVSPWDRESPYFKNKIASFEKSMNLIAARARQKGIPLIVGTLPSNLEDWPPVYKRLPGRDQRYLDTVEKIQKLVRDGQNQEASDAVAAGFSLYREDAMLYFLRGKIQSAAGDYVGARISFVKARDLDPVPVRTSSDLNAIIREIASKGNGVHLVDLEKVYEEHANNSLVGFDLVLDNVHSTPLGESLVAETIIRKMNEIGFLPFSTEIRDCCPVNMFLADAGYLAPKSPERLRAMLEMGIYVMKTPFLNYEISRKYLLEAETIDENSWQVWANLATLSYFSGDTSAGSKELKRATELRGSPLDVSDRVQTPYLKEALDYSIGRNNCGTPY